MNGLLQIEDLSIKLPAGADRPYAVEGVSLDIAPGEIVCVVGESGSGKSTLAHAILSLLPRGVNISGGAIKLDGQTLTGLPLNALRKIRGKRIAMVFQEPLSALNPLMRCGDQIVEMLREHDASDATINAERLAELLVSVGLADHRRIADSYPFQLSGGQRQRVMIAMALALEPEILIADEPTTALDVTTQAQILEVLLDIQKRKNLGVLFITHDFGVVSEIADRIVVMKDGRVVETGAAPQVLSHPQADYTRRLLAAVPSSVPPAAAPIAAPALLSVNGLRKTYVRKAGLFKPARQFPAVRDASFEIARGETVGLVGESGSGKSTIGRIVAGLIAADGGSVRLKGADLTAPGAFNDVAVRRSVQMVFQDPYGSLNPRHRVSTILTSGLVAQGVPRHQALRRARELMELVRLDVTALDRYPHEFSGGQRQRLGLARAIAAQPELIIADEPVSALDVSVQDQVLTLLKELKEKLHLSMLFITHDLRVAAQLCDRIVVLQQGAIVEQGTAAQVLQAPAHPYTRQLIDAVPGRQWK
ncbi:dipeptide ABC transporter ATP-binding protein [Achromobacter insolitus]|uniref:dipeptide ABC transporter ATP-binding protein n=1 Tax=Achromobacter insolitus TaxID=217204 RepID=UPI0007C3D037|nr:ABC transporter ATP-binding protein [Achromobacter insolitus]OAD14046.1 microcin ABC transporter ATP-binding protein [Achromobacter insolitus]